MVKHLEVAKSLDKNLVNPENWDNREVPEEFKTIANKITEMGLGAGIGYHDQGGWFVLIKYGGTVCLRKVENPNALDVDPNLFG